MSDLSNEILDRTKRIETRLTQLMIAQGIDTKARKPTYVPAACGIPASVMVPSMHSSLSEILGAIPDGVPGLIEIMIGTKVLAMISKH